MIFSAMKTWVQVVRGSRDGKYFEYIPPPPPLLDTHILCILKLKLLRVLTFMCDKFYIKTIFKK